MIRLHSLRAVLNPVLKPVSLNRASYRDLLRPPCRCCKRRFQEVGQVLRDCQRGPDFHNESPTTPAFLGCSTVEDRILIVQCRPLLPIGDSVRNHRYCRCYDERIWGSIGWPSRDCRCWRVRR